MQQLLTRREFIERSLAGGVAASLLPGLGQWGGYDSQLFGRVTASSIRVWDKPANDAHEIYRIGRDNIIQLYEEMDIDGYRNPRWYRVWGGYVHSSYIQPVQFNYQENLATIPESGCLFEVSVPYTRSLRIDRGQWVKNYRLYFNSTHWVTHIVQGPDGRQWYAIKDSYGRNYYARTGHLRKIEASELAPISPETPRNQKWIEVLVEDQELRAYEQGEIVMQTRISSGLPLNRELEPGELPTETPLGDFHITVKTVCRHMGESHFTDQLDSGAYPGVPWVCFFDKDGYSLHGTYWHNNFGNRMSHGCVNMRCEDAKWLYRWALPPAQPEDWQISGWGIRVSVRP